MNDFTRALRAMRRPRLLIRAARIGAKSYNRNKDLKRITHGDDLPSPDRALRRLMNIEAEMERARREREAAYSVTRHVDVLIALMAEARLLLRSTAAI